MDSIPYLHNSTYSNIFNGQGAIHFISNSKDQHDLIDNAININDSSTNNCINDRNICILSNRTLFKDSSQSDQIFSSEDQINTSLHKNDIEKDNPSNNIIKAIESLNIIEIDLSNFQEVHVITTKKNTAIYLIKDKSTKLLYVAKEIFASDYDAFFRELTILSKVNHPFIVKVIGYSLHNFKKEPSMIIIMDYIINSSLERILREERNQKTIEIWDGTMKLIIIYGIASAIRYLHSNGILHLDIKPDNVLIDEYIFPIIIDFGISLIKNCNNIKEPCFGGTIPYMAPEVCNGEKRTEKTDVYSFGVLLYVILAKKEPFKQYLQSQYQFMMLFKNQRPDLDDENIPIFFKDLIRRCWDTDPENRPTFNTIIEELKNFKDFHEIGVDEGIFRSFIELVESKENGTDLTFNLDDKFQKYNLDKLYKEAKQNSTSSISSVLASDNEDEEEDDNDDDD